MTGVILVERGATCGISPLGTLFEDLPHREALSTCWDYCILRGPTSSDVEVYLAEAHFAATTSVETLAQHMSLQRASDVNQWIEPGIPAAFLTCRGASECPRKAVPVSAQCSSGL